ncbi:MAG: hypothetical protein J5889_03435 [Clostridia bacterium]|nr:hypothetical protein [Clostridia bacterium]
MQSNGYQLLALAARALFVLLAALVALRAAMALLQQHRARKKLLRTLPDAGMVGELHDMDSDRGYPLPREAVLGGGRGCDIRLKGLCRRHLDLAYVEGKGILLTPARRSAETILDGRPLGRGAYALHGAMLRVGNYNLRVRLFAGLNVPHPASYQDHWQPIYEEELYAPDPLQGMPWSAVPAPQNDAGEPVPPFSYTQPVPIFETQTIPVVRVPETVPAEVDSDADAPPPFDEGVYAAEDSEESLAPFVAPERHRRSERRRTP